MSLHLKLGHLFVKDLWNQQSMKICAYNVPISSWESMKIIIGTLCEYQCTSMSKLRNTRWRPIDHSERGLFSDSGTGRGGCWRWCRGRCWHPTGAGGPGTHGHTAHWRGSYQAMRGVGADFRRYLKFLCLIAHDDFTKNALQFASN